MVSKRKATIENNYSGLNINPDFMVWVFQHAEGMVEIDVQLLAILAERSDSNAQGGCLTVGALQFMIGRVQPEPTEEQVGDALARLVEDNLILLSMWSPAHLRSWRLVTENYAEEVIYD